MPEIHENNHGFITKLSRMISNHPYKNCGFPEYEFRKIASFEGCKFEDVALSFWGASEERRKEIFQKYIYSTDKPDSNFESQKLILAYLYSDFRIAISVADPAIKRKRRENVSNANKALSGVKRLIPPLEQMLNNYRDYEHAELRAQNLPTLRQLKNLETMLSGKISGYDSYRKKYGSDNKSLQHAQLIADRMEVLFDNLGRKITRGSSAGELTSVFAKSLQSAFDVFGIAAEPITYARKIVERRKAGI